jgi:hypothetical protein
LFRDSGIFPDTKTESLKLAFYPKIPKASLFPKSSNKGQKRKKYKQICTKQEAKKKK